jgi:hypothetical protein
MLISYFQARVARVKSDYVYQYGHASGVIPLGGQAEVPDEIARLLLEKDGDILKKVEVAEKFEVEPEVVPAAEASAEVLVASDEKPLAKAEPKAESAPGQGGLALGLEQLQATLGQASAQDAPEAASAASVATPKGKAPKAPAPKPAPAYAVKDISLEE